MSRNTHRTDYIKWPCNAALITAEPQIRCLQPARKQSQRAIIIRTCSLCDLPIPVKFYRC